MSFLTPFMLWGTLAAGIPIALHFFFRSRYRTVPWAAMKFLLTSIEQTSRRLRFQELLLLIVRCLVLALLALAFARPLTTLARGSGRGDAVDAVFLMDVSYSMGGRDGAKTRLERAQQAALKILEELPPHSTVQVVHCADRAELLGPQSPGNLDQAAQIINNVKLTSLATDLAPGAVEAASILERGQAANKELYVFSDMQKSGWERQAGPLKRTLESIKDKAAITLVRCGTRPVKNVAVVGIAPQSGVPRPGERVGFAVLLRNTGTEAVERLNISLTVNLDDKSTEVQAAPLIAPGETRAIPLTAKLEKPGLHVLTAKLQTDDLDGDNRFDQILLVREQVNVLVVDGGLSERDPKKSSSYYLMNALVPVKDSDKAKYYLQPRVVPPRLASPALLARQDLCILVNAAAQPDLKHRDALARDFLDELGRFVREGHGLIIFAGDQVQADAYNRLLGQKLGLLPLKIKGVVERAIKEPLLVNRDSFDLPAFLKFKTDEFYKEFNRVEAYQALELDESQAAAASRAGPSDPVQRAGPDGNQEASAAPARVVLRFQNGLPALAAKQVDAGEVLLVTTAADPGWKEDSPNPTWTDWPLRFVYVPFIDVAVAHLLHGQTQNHNLTAGETLRWYPSEKMTRSFTLVSPGGVRQRLGLPEKVGNRLVVTASDLPAAGVYRLVESLPADTTPAPIPVDDKTSGIPLAVTPDLRESDSLETFSDEQLDQRLGFSPAHVTAGAEAGALTLSDRLNREWTTWLLMAVFGLVVAEALLAWWCGRAW
ncbi:MAG: BatA domain-containing protein [Gemmataceae bacterium]|nr:BatA domain-containing protein [Gemmataceae bacterium]